MAIREVRTHIALPQTRLALADVQRPLVLRLAKSQLSPSLTVAVDGVEAGPTGSVTAASVTRAPGLVNVATIYRD